MIHLVRYMEYHPTKKVLAVITAPGPFGNRVEHSVDLDAAQLPPGAWTEHDVAEACAAVIGSPVVVAPASPVQDPPEINPV